MQEGEMTEVPWTPYEVSLDFDTPPTPSCCVAAPAWAPLSSRSAPSRWSTPSTSLYYISLSLGFGNIDDRHRLSTYQYQRDHLGLLLQEVPDLHVTSHDGLFQRGKSRLMDLPHTAAAIEGLAGHWVQAEEDLEWYFHQFLGKDGWPVIEKNLKIFLLVHFHCELQQVSLAIKVNPINLNSKLKAIIILLEENWKNISSPTPVGIAWSYSWSVQNFPRPELGGCSAWSAWQAFEPPARRHNSLPLEKW